MGNENVPNLIRSRSPFTLKMLILPIGRSERSKAPTFEASKPYAKRRFCLHVSNDPKPLLGIMQCNLMSSAPWEEEAIERNAWEYRSLWLAVHSNSWHFFRHATHCLKPTRKVYSIKWEFDHFWIFPLVFTTAWIITYSVIGVSHFGGEYWPLRWQK